MPPLPADIISQIAKHQAKVGPACRVRDVGWEVVGGLRNMVAERAGVCGSYNAARDVISVYQYQSAMAGDVMMAPTWTHELTHAAQRRRMGLVGYIAIKTTNRARLEDEAVAAERKAQRILGVNVL